RGGGRDAEAVRSTGAQAQGGDREIIGVGGQKGRHEGSFWGWDKKCLAVIPALSRDPWEMRECGMARGWRVGARHDKKAERVIGLLSYILTGRRIRQALKQHAPDAVQRRAQNGQGRLAARQFGDAVEGLPLFASVAGAVALACGYALPRKVVGQKKNVMPLLGQGQPQREIVAGGEILAHQEGTDALAVDHRRRGADAIALE